MLVMAHGRSFPDAPPKSQLMTGSEIDRTLVRLAHEIIDQSEVVGRLAVVGIHRRGAVLGGVLAEKICKLENCKISTGSLDIKLYRDDLSTVANHPIVKGMEIPFSVDGMDVILVDDVLYTGRTVQSALGVLLKKGYPKTVRLCTLIDRGHRKLPIEAQFVGKYVETTTSEIIEVKLEIVDGEERVLVMGKED